MEGAGLCRLVTTLQEHTIKERKRDIDKNILHTFVFYVWRIDSWYLKGLFCYFYEFCNEFEFFLLFIFILEQKIPTNFLNK